MGERIRPSKEQLLALYEAAVAFWEAEPWQGLYDADLVCVENPLDGEIGYCSVMGKGGQHFGLCVFLGMRGLRGFYELMELGDEKEKAQAVFSQDYLLCSFGERGELDEEDLREIAGLGLTFQGANAWPQFRRYEPGYHPWYLTAEECVFLTHALQQVLEVVAQYEQGEVDIDFDQARTVLRKSEERDGKLTWQTTPWELQRPVLLYEPLEIVNELLLHQLRRAPRSINAVWEVEVCYLPVIIQPSKEERPFFPRGFVLADHRTGMIHDCHVYEDPGEDMFQVIDRLARHITNFGLPKEIRIKSDLLVAVLTDLCSKAGISLQRAASLPQVEALLSELGREL